jgi:large subunit ribosomal protein L14e
LRQTQTIAQILVDGPFSITKVARSVVHLNTVTLTNIVLPIRRLASAKTLEAAFKTANTTEAFNKTSLGKKLLKRSLRASLSDFDRFKVMIAKKQKNTILAKEAAQKK